MDATYKQQVALLVRVLPEVTKEKCFALHGGTAINLFVRNMPRLSVDIDLTYIPIKDRETSFQEIAKALARMKDNIESAVSHSRIVADLHKGKLKIQSGKINIKIEVSMLNRGVLHDPVEMPLCEKAQIEFNRFCTMSVVSVGQLFGGKIVAALDRQHPRDLFDVKYLFENEGLTSAVKEGFIYCLLCSDRPINEIISPNFKEQRLALSRQFSGMSDEEFGYDEYESTRKKLVESIQMSLSDSDKEFLLSVKNLAPDWSLYNFERFPSINWKMQNLQILKGSNPIKHQEQYQALKLKLRR